MRRTTIVFWAICGLSAAFFACAIFGCSSATHAPESFRGIKWGAKTSSVAGLSQVAVKGDLSLFEKSGDRLQLGDIKLTRVIYAFYKDQFYMGMAYFPSESFMKMEAVLTGKFGKPAEVDQNPNKLLWDSDYVSVVLTPAGPKQARVVYMYKPIQLQVELKK
ncbi:MAG: hypothetical protein ACP5IL_08415 [Syntrophobacteraceae bacterium]